jgi:hypothetical protein
MFARTQSTSTTLPRHLRGKAWLALVALVTALSFVSLVSVALTHIHTSSQEAQDCSLCSVVSDKVGTGQAAPALVTTTLFILYACTVRVLLGTLARNNHSVLPPSCGPPAFN